jgi:hypothetical protein
MDSDGQGIGAHRSRSTGASSTPIPDNSTIPERTGEAATVPDYDLYFGLDRGPVDLLRWTDGCLVLERELLTDLEATDLTSTDRNELLMGMLILYRLTLERWVHAARGEACER